MGSSVRFVVLDGSTVHRMGAKHYWSALAMDIVALPSCFHLHTCRSSDPVANHFPAILAALGTDLVS